MVSYTAAPTDQVGRTTTYDTPLAGGGTTQSVTGFDLAIVGTTTTYTTPLAGGGTTQSVTGLEPDSAGVATRTQGLPNPTGVAAEVVGATTAYTTPMAGGGTTQSVTGLEPDSAGTAARSKALPTPAGTAGVGTASTTDHTLGGTYHSGGFTQPEPTGLDPESGGAAALIPTSFFRKITGKVLDQDGNPVPEAKYILCLDALPTSGFVDDQGKFSAYILNQDYKDFVLVATSDEPGQDRAFYEVDGNPDFVVGDEQHDLKFDTTVEAAPEDIPTGLDMAASARFG